MTQPFNKPGVPNLEEPIPGSKGPRTPYPVNEPPDPRGPGSEPDYVPPTPNEPPARMQDGAARTGHVCAIL